MNAQLPPPTIDLTIPSELGYEKIAREAVAAFARRLGFDRERIEDLKTALCEACINAIEHGNAKTPGLRVEVHCTWEHEQLTIEVCDDGMKQDLPITRRAETSFGLPSIRGGLRSAAPTTNTSRSSVCWKMS
jgi:anti-sigma regulatory factor (Ser/Thr protein kinase)